MVDLAAEEFLRAPHDPLAAGEHPVDAVARMIPEREPDGASLAVGPAEGVLVEGPILLGGQPQEVDLLDVEEAAGDHEALAGVFGDLVDGEYLGHGSFLRDVDSHATSLSVVVPLVTCGA